MLGMTQPDVGTIWVEWDRFDPESGAPQFHWGVTTSDGVEATGDDLRLAVDDQPMEVLALAAHLQFLGQYAASVRRHGLGLLADHLDMYPSVLAEWAEAVGPARFADMRGELVHEHPQMVAS